MDVKIINPFLSSALNLFSHMFSIDAQAGEPYLLGDELKHRWEISGILGLTGDYQGLVGFRLPRLLADKMLERSGIETKTEEERQETVYGMIGEMTNIIAGNASSAIDHASIDISPPVVIFGENHRIAWPKTMPVIAIPFSSPSGPFEVDVCFKKK
ncbi:chemotaxis protein CheX [Treponema zuelzerae]|jgi:chemotaxis protein CheX|uniref:Chemotaxis protein CheX n=2 Tax=Teretinema zuelzerae TaxID=156 RepID=A0AAE3EK30_9SPIR|nr:chemotaxis protein CheX [Spirochaetales bacterium]MCD1656162.1 chemotaxis protein CheX [Teretinema zuelzerae]